MSSISRKALAKGTAGTVLAAYLAAPDATEIGLLTTGAVGTVYGGYTATQWALEIPHRWNWITPLHKALCGPLGIDKGVKPTSYIHISRNYQTGVEVGRIDLPAEYATPDPKVQTIIKAKLGLSDASATFHLAGRKPHISIRQTPRPPGKCYFPEHQLLVEQADESAPLIGIGPQNKQVSVDLDAESPHVLVSASTGGGKSVIMRTMTAQMLHHGAQLSVLDFKRHSHKWAKGLPQVRYCRAIEEIHGELIRLGAEGHCRNILVDDWEGEGEPYVGPRVAVVLEEANATISKLKRFWMEVRTKDDPKESPAISALRELLFMGRAVKMHVLLVAQSATAAALGGPEVRECFSTRILTRYTQNAWRMLVPEVHPIPRSTRHVGRVQVVLGGVATETQVLFFTDDEAIKWAMSGTVAPPPGRHVTRVEKAPTREDVVSESRDVTPELTLVQGGRMSLAEAARQEVVPMKADALRKAKSRDPEFPEGLDGKYTAEELTRWFNNRPVKQSA